MLLQSTFALADSVFFRAGVSAEEARSRMWLFDSKARPLIAAALYLTLRFFSDVVLIPLRLHASGWLTKTIARAAPHCKRQ